MREGARDVLDVVSGLNDVAYRPVLSKAVDVSQLPEMTVATPLTRSEQTAVGQTDDMVDLIVVVRRKGTDAIDQLDDDSGAIEAALVPYLQAIYAIAELSLTTVEPDTSGKTPFGQLTMTFRVLHFA